VRLIAGRDLVPSIYGTFLATKYTRSLLVAYSFALIFSDPPDIIVQLIVAETTKRSTPKEKCRLNPEWDEKHIFQIKNPYEQFLNVEVKDKNHDQIYGVLSLPLADLYEYVERITWHKLKALDGAETRCELLLGLTLGPNFQ